LIASAAEFVSLRLSTRPEEYLRAAEDAAPLQVWQDVIANYPQMRQWVAHNKTVPLQVLVILAHDPDVEVRLFVAMKNKLSSELYTLLSEDHDDGVRARIAHNKNTPRTVLQKLAKDPSRLVAESAAQKLIDGSDS